MSKYESGVKQIPHPQKVVYDTLSDLNNIERVKDRIPADKVQDLTFDHDTVSISVPPVGAHFLTAFLYLCRQRRKDQLNLIEMV